MRTRGILITVTTALCCTGVAAAGSGGSFGGFATGTDTDTASMNTESATAKPDCPGNREPVAAGFKTTASGDTGPVIHRLQLRRAGATATGTVFNDGAPTTYKVKGYAHCAQRAPGLTKETKRVVIADGDTKTAKARCPDGRQVISGGFKTRYNPDFVNGFTGNIVLGSRPAGTRGWKANGFGVNEGSPVPLTAIAYCADVDAISIERKRIGSSSGDVPAKASCPSGKLAVGGGFKSKRVPVNLRERGFELFAFNLPKASRRSGERSWKAVGLSSPFGTAPWTAYAVCAKG